LWLNVDFISPTGTHTEDDCSLLMRQGEGVQLLQETIDFAFVFCSLYGRCKHAHAHV
jgi:hypothetical protein